MKRGSSPKPAPKKSGGDLDRLLLARANADKAQARADAARAQAQLVKAKIEASGKQVVWDPKTGAEKIISR